MAFQTISAKEWADNPFHTIAQDWLLLCVKDKENARVNAMTASWGGMGILWNKEVCFLFVRPQRHTHTLLENETRFAVAVLPEELHAAHKICGAQSGREKDKLRLCGLDIACCDGVSFPEKAKTVLLVKTLYKDTLRRDGFLDPTLLQHYPQEDYHTVYVCEIERVLVKSEEEKADFS